MMKMVESAIGGHAFQQLLGGPHRGPPQIVRIETNISEQRQLGRCSLWLIPGVSRSFRRISEQGNGALRGTTNSTYCIDNNIKTFY